MRGKELVKRLLILPPIAIGAAVLAYVLALQQPPERAPEAEKVTRITVIEAQKMAVVPRALGFGNVEPQAVWQAVAEVQGRVIAMHPKLRKGATLPRGTVLFEIDPIDYRLQVAEAEANLDALLSEIADLAVQESNTQASLAIESKALALSTRERERKRRLVKRGALSEAALDSEERSYLAVEQRVQELKNARNRFPVERRLKQAQKALYEARLEEARRDLGRTTIRAPFDLRIAELNAEAAQFAAAGSVLAIADSIDVAEVTAQIAIGKMRQVVRAELPGGTLSANTMSRLTEVMELGATVWQSTQDQRIAWPARFARFSDTIDPETRTVGVIVAVDEPYAKARPGVRPPLVKGMYVEVEIRGPARPGLIVAPRAAVWDGHVQIVDSDDRLRRRAVRVAFEQTNFVAIAAGLETGDRIVVGDLIPAIEGMLLAPVLDEALMRRLAAEATGRAGVK
ncbi:MAG: efflux RND transporter periplasmic adaptor subunit [Alphaproteobacteria bacterium]|jgi:multidrug efflux pump subunit AcrA (membrane-fusion protein)|nr:efflux RND transporter periplasmic adaptor subunit [Alphaproteobacteria bacterium]